MKSTTTNACLQQTMSFGQQTQSFRQFDVVYVVVVMATAGACCQVVVVISTASDTAISVNDVVAIDHRLVSVYTHVHKPRSISRHDGLISMLELR